MQAGRLLQATVRVARVEAVPPRIPPPILMFIAGGLMWALDRWLPLAHWIDRPWNRIGVVPVVLGVAVSAAAMMRFRHAHTTINPVDLSKSSRLVTGGIFRVSRNPMYLGLSLLLIGCALGLGSASPWCIPPLFVVLITRVQIIPEEQALGGLFGEPYAAYCQRTARWLGVGR
jgi:protein-S-isoprenylcysteine O-methyltransferase Ste14